MEKKMKIIKRYINNLLSEMNVRGKELALLATDFVAEFHEGKTAEDVFKSRNPIKQIYYRTGYGSTYISGALFGAFVYIMESRNK